MGNVGKDEGNGEVGKDKETTVGEGDCVLEGTGLGALDGIGTEGEDDSMNEGTTLGSPLAFAVGEWLFGTTLMDSEMVNLRE